MLLLYGFYKLILPNCRAHATLAAHANAALSTHGKLAAFAALGISFIIG